MEEFIDFAGRNPLLFIALAAVITLIVFTELRRFTQGYKTLTPTEAVMLINKEDAMVLDVREANELSQGSIIDAKHVAISALSQKANNLSKDKDKPVLVFCKMGNRSAEACKLLLKNNYTKVYNLKGGMNAWINDQLPVTKK